MIAKNVIELRNIVKQYGAVRVVDDVSFELRESEFFALLGPSGCGKTTLLRVMAGFADPSSGQMLLDGQDMVRVPPRRRPLNMMFQSYALFPHMTAEANIRYGLENARLPKEEIARRTAEIMVTTQLTEFARRKPAQLSGGQRQRVALARALVMRPRVLLLDEPLGALDKKLREAMQLELKRLQNELGITFVVVTHDQEEALVMADRIALMRGGRVEQIGPASELYEKPTSRFVADFIGQSNFFEGTASGSQISVDGLGLLHGPNDASVSGAAVLSVRPERIKVNTTPVRSFDNSFAGTVREIAYHGQDEHIHVEFDDWKRPVIARLPAYDETVQQIHEGTRVWLSWNGRDARILAH